MTTPSVTVPIGPCLCPGTPHPEGDTIDLRERLGLVSGRSLQALMFVLKGEGVGEDVIVGRLSEAYILHGAVSWNLTDENGPIPLTPETIQEHLLSDFSRASGVADKADELYAAAVIHPLVQMAAKSSSTTTTNGSTSPTPIGSRNHRKQSKPSSTSTTRTAATATTTR